MPPRRRSPRDFGADPGLTFKTSGSSGEPRLVAQPIAALLQEVDALAAIFPGAARIIALAPAHHIYGFLHTVLLPHRLGLPVLDARAHAPGSVARLLRDGDVVVAFPTFWQAAAEAGVVWPGGVVGTSSGAPCPPQVGPALRRQNLSRLVEIYGSTETGGIGWRDDAENPFRLMPYWRREGEDRLSRDFGLGARSYELPDVVSWSDAETLRPVRRRDGAVQVGGVNVYPELVCAVLKAHPGVADAAVRLMRPHEGERLKAFVALKDEAWRPEAFRAELEAWLQQRLTAVQIPRAFSFGPRLPVDDRGKLCDWTI